MFQTDLAENICNAVSDRRSRCQRKIDDAKRNTKSSGRFLCNQLAYSRNLERRFFDRLAQYFKTLTAYLLQGSLYNARTADTDVDDRICLGHAVECSCHKRVVIRCIAEYNQLCTAKRILLSCIFCCLFYDLAHQAYRIHVDTAFCGANVDGTADTLCNRECFRNGANQILIALCHAL